MSISPGDKVIITYPNSDKLETTYLRTGSEKQLRVKHGTEIISLGWNGNEWFVISDDDDTLTPVKVRIVPKPTLSELIKTTGTSQQPAITSSVLTDINLLVQTAVKDFPNLCQTNKTIYTLCMNPSYDARIYKERFVKYMLPMFGADGKRVLEELSKFPITFLTYLEDISILTEEERRNCTVANWKDVYDAFTIVYNFVRNKRDVKSFLAVAEQIRQFGSKTFQSFVKRSELNFFIDASENERIFNSISFVKLITILTHLFSVGIVPEIIVQENQREEEEIENPNYEILKNYIKNIHNYIYLFMGAQYNIPLLAWYLYVSMNIGSFVENGDLLISIFAQNVYNLYDFVKLLSLLNTNYKNIIDYETAINRAADHGNMEVFVYLKEQHPTYEGYKQYNSYSIKYRITRLLTHPVLTDEEKILNLDWFIELYPVNYTLTIQHSNLSERLYEWLYEHNFTINGNVLRGYAENDDIEMIEYLMSSPYNVKPTLLVCRRSSKYSEQVKSLLNCSESEKVISKFSDAEIKEKIEEEFDVEFDTDKEFRETLLNTPQMRIKYQNIASEKKRESDKLKEIRKQYGRDTVPEDGDEVVLNLFGQDMTFEIRRRSPWVIKLTAINFGITLDILWDGVDWGIHGKNGAPNIILNNIQFL